MSVINEYPHNELSELTRQRLTRASTATLHTLMYKRGLRNTYIQNVGRMNNSSVKMVGQAYTLRYIPAREDIDKVAVFRDPEHPQRLAVETVPAGRVLISDCRQDASAASAGSILLTRLQFRECAGFVADAGIRDSDHAREMTMPVFCTKPSAPTNLTKHHALAIQQPIGCGGVPVYPGDVLVGDGDGVIVVPLEIADEIAEEASSMESFEDYVIKRVSEGAAVIGLYPPNEQTREEYSAYVKQQQD